MAAAPPPPAQSPLRQACIPCPDPSAHYKNTSLQEQASTAALCATNPDHSSSSPRDAHSDPKLSSAGAAASLKYARPQDLPSFPVIGIDPHASGLTAATLATANPKSVEWWKPSQSESAGRAALLAHDYKMSPSWQPEASAAGSKAALLAHKEGAKSTQRTSVASRTGNAAAGAALRGKGQSPLSDHGRADDDHKRALIAATGAFSGSRRRAESTPTPIASFPDASNSKRNALSAATIANRPSRKSVDAATASSPALDAARVHNIARNVAREMYTEAPPVDIEVEEKKHQDALRASAISMAKQMYSIQQAHINEVTASLGGAPAPAAAVMAHNDHGQSSQPSISSDDDLKQQAMQYISLQEAAQRMAAERLAKIKTDDDAAAFRDYYGYSKKQPRRRLSVKLTRRRASSEGEMLDSDDEERSRRIRKQMSAFNNRLAEVDAKKRQKDREALLAVAQKKVEAQMHDMDEKMFIETGKTPPAILEEWEAKARARAAASGEARKVNHGKVHVGGGKYLDQAEIDAVAAARIEPTLKEINEKAEEKRAKDEELRLDQEEKRRQARLEKEREAESKALEKRLKSEEKQATKARKAEKKAAARAERNAETAKHAEETKIKKEEKLKAIEADQISSPGPAPSTDPDPDSKPNRDSSTEPAALDSKEIRPQSSASSSSGSDKGHNTLSSNRQSTAKDSDNMKHSTQDPMASPPLSPTLKSEKRSLRSFLNKFKRRSKHQDMAGEASSPTQSSFVGGHALTGARPESHRVHRHSSPPTIGRPTSFVRVAGANPYVVRATTSPSVSSLSSDDWEAHRAGRPTFNRTTSGLSRSGISDDEFDESRDAFDERLAPPPKFMASEGRVSPVRETIFREEL